MTRGTKSWWIVHVAAGVAAVALVAFGMTQCSGKNDARDEVAAARQEVVKAGEKIDGAVAKIDSLVNANRGLSDENRAQADTIRMQRDSIAVLNDSLAVVNDQLVDCRNSKKQPVKKAPVKKEPVKKEPVKVQPRPAAKDTVVVVVKEGAKKCATPATVVELDDSKNTGNIVVSGKCGGTQVKLGNGSVNNGNIVVGNNNHVVLHNQVVADTLARYAKTREIIVECEIQTTRRVYK
ncbi:MAG: hypothetical protein IJX43_04400 [Alphaproteobacteria bacterium]|nr:hypothetical protein [Alphaproteobacteria bacterium]MBQ8368268.1 hypothetical protein [Alphaproteobacteria bacterium]